MNINADGRNKIVYLTDDNFPKNVILFTYAFLILLSISKFSIHLALINLTSIYLSFIRPRKLSIYLSLIRPRKLQPLYPFLFSSHFLAPPLKEFPLNRMVKIGVSDGIRRS